VTSVLRLTKKKHLISNFFIAKLIKTYNINSKSLLSLLQIGLSGAGSSFSYACGYGNRENVSKCFTIVN
jgi:hypothetical protein